MHIMYLKFATIFIIIPRAVSYMGVGSLWHFNKQCSVKDSFFYAMILQCIAKLNMIRTLRFIASTLSIYLFEQLIWYRYWNSSGAILSLYVGLKLCLWTCGVTLMKLLIYYYSILSILQIFMRSADCVYVSFATIN